VLFAPLDGDHHLDEAWIDADRIAVGEEHHVRPTVLQKIKDGDPVRDPGRVVRHHDEAALVRDTLAAVHFDIQVQLGTGIFERLKPRHVGNGIGEL